MITYIRNSEMPTCKHCKVRMGYWVPGLPDSEHAHTECSATALANEAIEKFRHGCKKLTTGATP